MPIRFLFLICFLSGFLQFTHGQDLPEPPVIEYVSVNPATGRVFIQWTPSISDSIDGYLINDYGYYTVGGTSILNVPPGQSVSFNYPDVNKRPVTFTLNTTKKGKLSGFAEPKHRPVYLSSKTDSCAHTITLKWTKYIGWGNNIKEYRINYLHDGFVIDSIGTTLPTDTSFVVTLFDVNKSYNYYITAFRKDGTFSNSNKDSVYLPGAKIPDFITTEQATITSDNQAEIQFSLDISSEVKNYQLSRSSNPVSGFQPVKKFPNYTGSSLIVTDTVHQTMYYRLELLNSCNNPVKYSNLGTVIYPEINVNGGNIVVSWPAYVSWKDGVSSYDVFRYTNDTPELIGPVSQTTYNDNINALMGKKISGNICYSLEAKENNGTHTSVSAKRCIDLDLTLFIPEAFTPDGNGKNDVFLPFFAFLPANFTMVIYNRYGFKVFETKDPFKGWDGLLASGKNAPDGVYVYFITYQSSSGKTMEKSGNFSLIYP